MRALLLAAGLGTRLRPITDTTPKCLVSIGNKPLLQIWLERLSEAGIGPFLINTHYLADQVRTFVEESPFQKRIKLVHEINLLGTAGTLIENLDFFQGEDVMLIHADNYCLADLTAFERAHMNRPLGCVMTMMTFRTDDPSSCGIVNCDERGVVIEYHEKVDNPPSNLANAAVYILTPAVINFIGGIRKEVSKDVIDFSTEVLPHLIDRIYTFHNEVYHRDIGNIESLRAAQFENDKIKKIKN
jgi:mannose-1-phosphate guanylyltransferase